MKIQEILQALAPEFVVLDEFEKLATPGPMEASPERGSFGQIDAPPGFRMVSHFAIPERSYEGTVHDLKFYAEARNQTRALLVAHAQALLKLAEREWQPISTAPKDGSWVLLFSPEDVVPRVGRWCDLSKEWLFTHDKPTFWQPLPAPPKEVK